MGRRLYRVLENGIDDYNINVYREPFELEFSREEINQFICYFQGYLNGFFETIDQSSLSPFLKYIDSNLILYGYREGNLFEEDFESEEDYQQAIAAQGKSISITLDKRNSAQQPYSHCPSLLAYFFVADYVGKSILC